MKRSPFRRFTFRKDKGFALIIVLFFVVLMTGLTVAYLARAITARRVSDSSAAQAKALLLAQTAGQITILDLKQEIIDGSTASSPATGVTIYTPKPGASSGPIAKKSTVTPAVVGFTPAISGGVETDGLANLLKISRNGVAFYTGGNYAQTGVSRTPLPLTSLADASNSTMTPSLNGRYVSPSRWNSHYLIARDSTATGNDSTPTDTFFTHKASHSQSLVPDWILVTRDGTNPKFSAAPNISSAQITNYTGTTDTIINPSPANNSYVIGRYAYAIYNEGGLLDMNVAGYPSNLDSTSGSAPVALRGQAASYKSSIAMADLTQLPVPSSNPLTRSQIDNIIAWRNNYTSQFSASTFPTATFSNATAGNWLTNFVQYNSSPTNFVVTTSNGKQVATANNYLGVNTNTLTGSSTTTDQVFLSRQQLISLTQSLNISPDALQYLGTFSRALDQPSYTPDPNRPTIIPGTPPAAAAANTYVGNNDYAGQDTVYNPAFPSIRVTTSFTRWNGAQAVVGEPLVKTRFPLSRLAMVAYNATNASAKGLYATAADPDPIYDRFGLTWDSTNLVWVYNHGQNYIMALKDVAAAGREPDFAELLKASINLGSLAKGGPNLVNGGNSNLTNLQYVVDTSVDFQVLQIMANLIDQQDKDSYPTRIQLKGNSDILCGIEDLPYLYRFHTVSVVDRAPSTSLSALSLTDEIFPEVEGGLTITATIPFPGGQSLTWAMHNSNNHAQPFIAQAGTLTDTGEVTHLLVPEVWNPHDANGLPNETTAQRPTQFRISATTVSPYNNMPGVSDTPWAVNMIATLGPNVPLSYYPDTSGSAYDRQAAYFDAEAPVSSVIPTGTLTTGSLAKGSTDGGNTALKFSDNQGKLFREPTMLWHNNISNLNLTGSGVKPTTPQAIYLPPTGVPSGMPTAGLPDVANSGAPNYFGFVIGQMAAAIQVKYDNNGTKPTNTAKTTPTEYTGKSYIFQAIGLFRPDPGSASGSYLRTSSIYGQGINTGSNFPGLPADSNTAAAFSSSSHGQISIVLEYQDPSGNWIPYDWKYPDLANMMGPSVIMKNSDFPSYTPSNTWANMQQMYPGPDKTTYLSVSQVTAQATCVDPRTGRWGMSKWGLPNPLQFNANNGGTAPQDTNAPLDGTSTTAGTFNVLNTQEPIGDKGFWTKTAKPGDAGTAANMRWFNTANFYAGTMAFNNPYLTLTVNGTASQKQYYEDADGVARRAMGAYAVIPSASYTASLDTASPSLNGMALATANTLTGPLGAKPTVQSQSRPFVLNRSFHSVEEMGYAFTGTPWKNIDFFTPESGDAALLDTFCIGEPPADGIVSGKVDLNTRQEPVLQALEAETYRDEAKNMTSPPTYALPVLTTAEATAVAKALVGYTTTAPNASITWKGPFANVSEIVGKYVQNPGSSITAANPAPSTSAPDAYSYISPSGNATNGQAMVTYAGFSGLLNSTIFSSANSGNATTASSTTSIQRFREAALRPLVDATQTRVWNLLIDVVAQTGHYPKTATTLDQFVVDGEKRIWLHVAIDRYTGQVVDKQVEVVSQ